MLGRFPLNSYPVNGPWGYRKYVRISAVGDVAADSVGADALRDGVISVGGVVECLRQRVAASVPKFMSATADVVVNLTFVFAGKLRAMTAVVGEVYADVVQSEPLQWMGIKASGVVEFVRARSSSGFWRLIAATGEVVADVAQALLRASRKMRAWRPYGSLLIERRDSLLRAERFSGGDGELRVDEKLSGLSGLRYVSSLTSTFEILSLKAWADRFANMIAAGQVVIEQVKALTARMLLGSASGTVEIEQLEASMATNPYGHEPYYRTVFVRNDASTTRMRVFRKQPAEILPYDIEFAEWFEPLYGDDIESAQATITGAVNGEVTDLTIDSVFIIDKSPEDASHGVPPTRVKIWLSGGIHGAIYKITARVDTEGGRRKEVDFRLSVKEV